MGLVTSTALEVSEVDPIIVRMHGLDSVRSKTTTHVLLFTVPSTQSLGAAEFQLKLDYASGPFYLTTTAVAALSLEVVAERGNRNYYLWAGMNFVGLGLVPANSSTAHLMEQPVTAGLASEYVNAIRDYDGRDPRLKDVVEAVFVFDCPDEDKPSCVDAAGQSTAAWSSYHTADPLAASGTAVNPGSMTSLRPLQGMFFKTRTTSTPSQGGPLPVFETVAHGGLGVVNVPVKMNVVGQFLDSAQNGTTAPPERDLKFGWNLIAPHTREAAPFREAFGDLVAPKVLASRAISFIREVSVGFGGSIVADVVQQFAVASWNGTVRPDHAYWVRVNPDPEGLITPVLGYADVGAGPVQPPHPPTVVTAVAGNSQATVSWSPSASDGGEPIAHYAVAASPGGAIATTTATTTAVTGLANGTAYTLTRIHRRTSLGTALEEAGGCPSESGIMVLEQKPARKQGAPNRCCHRTNPTVSASSLTTIAWWPMPACSCRPP